MTWLRNLLGDLVAAVIMGLEMRDSLERERRGG